MVWKLLAGIEDGVDNGWLLIRADAGSLPNSSSHSFLCVLRTPCSVRRSNHRKWPCIAYVPGVDWNEPIGLDEALRDAIRLGRGQEVIRVPRGAAFSRPKVVG